MAVQLNQRSTYWVVSGGTSPNVYGDYRFYWIISYEQTDDDKANLRSKVIVDTYLQTHFTQSPPDDWTGSGYTYYPDGRSDVYINGSNVHSTYVPGGTIQLGENWALTYKTSYSVYLKHKEDGTCSFTWRATGFGKGTSTDTYTLPRIDRPSVLSNVSTFNVEDGVTINATKYVSNFFDKLDIYAGSTLINTIYGFTSRTITFSETDLDNIYAAIPTGDSGTFTFKLSTYANSEYTDQIGSVSTKTAKGNLKIILPEFTTDDCYYTDIYNKTKQLTSSTSTSNKIVNGYSTVYLKFVNHARVYTRGATLSHYIVNGERGDYDPETGAPSAAFYPNYSGSTITVFAVDSRGTSSLPMIQDFEADGNFIDYKIVTKDYNNTCERSDNGVGSQVTISFSGTWWNNNFGVVDNTIGAKYKYKKTMDNEYTEGTDPITLTINENKYSFTGLIKGDQDDNGFDISESYDIIVIVEDALSSVEIKYTLSAGEPAIAIYKNKVALGAMYDETLGGTQIWGDLYYNGEPIEINTPDTPDTISFASMKTNSTKSFTSDSTLVTNWDTENQMGDYEIDLTNSRIVIKNTTLCQLSGNVAGHDGASLRIQITDSDDKDFIRLPLLVQYTGNGYWSSPIQTRIIVLDPTKTYYAKLFASAYTTSSFNMNNGFSNDATWISALKIK